MNFKTVLKCGCIGLVCYHLGHDLTEQHPEHREPTAPKANLTISTMNSTAAAASFSTLTSIGPFEVTFTGLNL